MMFNVSLNRQRGVALFMVMMVTLVIVALSVSLATGVFNDRKLSRNTADHVIARQGAEAALRDAEHDINCQRWNTVTNAFEFYSTAQGNPRPFCVRATEVCRQLGTAGVNATCSLGLRAMPLADNTGNMPAAGSFVGCSALFGANTAQPATVLGGQIAQPNMPRYSIEVFADNPTGGNPSTPIYRIHARGYGRSTDLNPNTTTPSNTTVDLEAIYRPCN